MSLIIWTEIIVLSLLLAYFMERFVIWLGNKIKET